MYLDGHKWEDVVNYRKDFVARWVEMKSAWFRWQRWENCHKYQADSQLSKSASFASSFSHMTNQHSSLMIDAKTPGMHQVQNQHLNKSMKGSH